MEVGIPGEGPEPPQSPEPPGPSEAPGTRPSAGHAAKWVLAAVGAALAYLATQVAALVAVVLALPMADIDRLAFLATTASLVLAVLWWRRLRPGARLRREVARPSRPERRVLLACALLVLGVVLQVTLSVALTMVLPLFPEVMDFYLELMELAGISGQTDLVTLLDIAVLAPAAEETICRGVALEFCLRAFCPGQRPAAQDEIPTACFWAANVVQALIFAVMHLNIVQGVYAFGLGLLLGWIVRRTGRLRAAVLLHMAVNGASELMTPLEPLLDGALVPTLVVGGLVSAALVLAVARLTAERRGEARAGTV